MLRKDTLKRQPTGRDTSNPSEVARFNALAEEWWNPSGKFKVVHAFNSARVSYLVPHIAVALGASATGDQPLSGLKIADVGCGAGLVSEPLARAGAEVFAIAAAERNVAIARHHATAAGVDDLTYETALPAQLAQTRIAAYDADV